ncbi:ATP-binding cassette domain-containing protein [Evansella halocellulosilytica]|uniref:ATP-binding cassette domain-containing protein n=1 Tax=Evansella halocellulosilytica TaxID=2011013 RepID=UPI000BB6C15F|nr:AAA family ATPase [Evansella halocellulosilytica]
MIIENVSYHYPKTNKKILNKVTITMKQDKLNVILGKNGAGKTTLFDVITGLIVPQKGSIQKLPSSKEIVYGNQGLYFSNALKGKDYVRLLLHSDHQMKEKLNGPVIREGMTNDEQTKMEELWFRPIGQMSVGERRWLLTFSMSCMDRKLYLFDEPTSGVDPDARIQIMQRLQAIAVKKDKTVVMSTHTLHELQFYDAHLILLHEGSIVYQGDYDQFLREAGESNPDLAFQKMTLPKRSSEAVK